MNEQMMKDIKASPVRWTPLPDLRWTKVDGGRVLQQLYVRFNPDLMRSDCKEWRDVPEAGSF